jgi:WD40 repeat protein
MKNIPFLFLLLFISYSPATAQVTLTEADFIVRGHTDDLEALAVSSKYIATGSRDRTAAVYMADSPYSLVKTFTGFVAPVTAIRFARNGALALATNNTIYLYDSLLNQSRMLEGHSRTINAFMFDANGRFLYSGGDDGLINVWDLTSGKNTKTINNGSPVYCFSQLGNTRMIFVGDRAARIKVYSLTSYRVVKTMDGHADMVNTLDISRNGRYMISGSNDKTARIWEMKTAKELRKLQVDCWKVTAANFSDDSKYAITGCNDGSVKIWEVATGKLLGQVEATGNNVREADFLAGTTDRIVVASYLRGSQDFGVRIWNTGIKPETPAAATGRNTQGRKDTVRKSTPPGRRPSAPKR